MLLTTTPEPSGNYDKNPSHSKKRPSQKKKNKQKKPPHTTLIPNPQTMFRKKIVLLFFSYAVTKTYIKDETVCCH